MKVQVEVECTPEEARAFLGLPDVRPLNDKMVSEMTARLEKNAQLLDPEPFVRSWMSLGGQAQDAFMRLMAQAVTGARRDDKT